MEKRSFETSTIVKMHLVYMSLDGGCFAVAAFVLTCGVALENHLALPLIEVL